MKYIRTDDGRIIDLNRTVYDSKLVHLDENQIDGGNWAGWFWYSTDEHYYEIECRDVDIINQDNTIEELCDEFVCLENKMTFHDLETITSSCNLKHLTIYGAIWTDKGLIYVAKMNDKGELVLLCD